MSRLLGCYFIICCAIIAVSVIHSEILRLQCKSSANYTINVNDAALEGSLIMKLYFRTDEECRFACLMDVRCKSYNKEIEGNERCELNDKTTEIKEDKVTLVKRPGWIFKSTNYSDPLLGENCINVDPCPENVMCRDTCSYPGYKCYPCPKGKFGLRCDKDCDKLMTSASGSFQSPNYPSPYPNNASCIYRISLPGGTKINLDIEKIDLESSQNCTNDKLRIYDGMNASATKLARICNSSDNARQFNSSGNHLFLVFKSDSRVTKTGFKASYTTIPPACNMLMTSGNQTFQSPNYPYPYPHITTCEFNISLPVGNRITLDINDIDLQQCNGCKCDSLSIYNGSSSNATKLATICNSSDIGKQFNSSGNHLFVLFKSDGNVTKSGFQASYTAIPPGCDSYATLSEADRAHSYVGGYDKCDDHLATQWYRFSGAAGNRMRSSCISRYWSSNRCGTYAGGWLKGAHPSVAEGEVSRIVCFAYAYESSCCSWSKTIKVKNCGGFYIYYLSKTYGRCNMRYCGSG